MTTGNFFAHTCPPAPTSCVEFWLYETQHGSIPSSQNIDQQPTNGMWQNAEAAFMAETVNCPGANWQTCHFSETTGHYINIMSATNWAGVASTGGDFVEDFTTPPPSPPSKIADSAPPSSGDDLRCHPERSAAGA